MKRRNFIYNSSLIAMSVGVFGKIKWDGKAYVGEDPTTTDILGPFYRPGAPMRSELVQQGSKGQLLHFSGTVFAKDGKTPLSNSLVEIWHCDENGVYDNTSDNYIYRAALKTGKDGKYHFKTILPVPYLVGTTETRPAHIHMRISGNTKQDLVTQVYFKGDKYIAKDDSAGDPRSLNRILESSTNSKNEKIVTFDIVLRDEYVLDAAGFKKVAGLYEMKDKSLAEFYRQDDQLFVKINGQIMEAMDYKGNNSFEGGLARVKAEFELAAGGSVKVKASYMTGPDKYVTMEGTKTLKYPN
ncbi:MAG: catechol 1,2-dioxygenase [Chitinophagaceae bacterium]|nr:catechol 1,2-dioxygenase [Chitinophagaceae bacterium]